MFYDISCLNLEKGMTITMNQLIEINKIDTLGAGSLSFFEANKDVPFEIKRIYFTYDVPIEVERGMHAHKKLNQCLWCPYGEIEVFLDNGEITKTYLLDAPNKLLLVGSGIWRNMRMKKEGSILCVAASDYYDENDYIRNYDEFLLYVKRGYWENENKL